MGRTGRSLWSTLNYGSHGPVEIVDLPHEKMVDLSIVLLVFPEGVSEMKSHDLVGGLEHDVFFSIIYGIIVPIYFHIFQDG